MKKLTAVSEKNQNPFYGLKSMLDMFQQLPKVGTEPNENTIHSYLTKAYSEATTQDKKELFYSILFSLGDIPNRKHNLFSKEKIKNVDNGGSGLRLAFFYCLRWMLSHNQDTERQFYKFLPIIGEYSNNQNSIFYQIRTDRFKGTVQKVLKLPINIEKVTDYIYSVISNPKTSEFEMSLWAKFLPRVDFGKRTRVRTVLKGREKSVSKKLGKDVKEGDTYKISSPLQEQTLLKEKFEYELINSLSKKMNWEIAKYKKNTRFLGLENFKKLWLSNSESHLFSSKKILDFDKVQFINWLNILPSGARYRVQKRLLDKDSKSKGKWIGTYGDLADWFKA